VGTTKLGFVDELVQVHLNHCGRNFIPCGPETPLFDHPLITVRGEESEESSCTQKQEFLGELRIEINE
jgi:hypothetical protein